MVVTLSVTLSVATAVAVGEGMLLALGVEERELGGVRLPLVLPVPVAAAVTDEV